MHKRGYWLSFIVGIVFSLALGSVPQGFAEEGYPEDYTPSTQAEGGRRKSLDRVFAIAAYMTGKLETAGGENSPECYRNCLTIPL